MDLLRHAPAGDVRWIVVFFQDGPLVDAVKELGIQTYVVETGRLRNIGRYLGALWKITSLAYDESVDLILSWAAKPHLYGSLAAQLAGAEAVWYQHGYPSGRHLGWMDRLATALPAQMILTPSRRTKQCQHELWPQRPARVVHPSVRLAQFDPDHLPSSQEAREELGLPQKVPLIGIVGRLQHWKGMHTLVEALSRVHAAYPKAHAVIVGGQDDAEPDYAPFLDRLIQERGLDDYVIRAGFQTNIPHWIQALDVFVHASDREPFGIVILEAMALGKPVVAGNQGGPREIISEGRNGLFAPFEDDQELARQVLRYLENPNFARRMGQNARERALEFSPDRYARRLVDVVHELVGSPDENPVPASETIADSFH